MFSLKSRLFQDFPFNCTPSWTIWSSKFQKFSGEGLTEPPPQTPPPLFLGLRPRFGLRPIRTPQLLKRGCALETTWAGPSEQDHDVIRTMWAGPCEHYHVSRTMWERPCEQDHVSKTIWAGPSEQDHVSKRNRERHQWRCSRSVSRYQSSEQTSGWHIYRLIHVLIPIHSLENIRYSCMHDGRVNFGKIVLVE